MRSTLSSQRATMSRSCSSTASAMPASRCQRFVVADHQRLAAGVGAGHHQQQVLRLLQPAAAGRAARRLVKQQELERRARAASRRARAGPARCRPAHRAGPRAAQQHDRPFARLCSSACSAASGMHPAQRPRRRLAAITAKGFSSRCLRWRRLATASALRASQARWKPPRPLMATMRPSRSRRQRGGDRVARDRPPLRIDQRAAPGRTPGRHWARHGSAGRSGSAYSRRTPGTAGKAPCWSGAVVGQRAGQRVARAAVGAVDEGIAVAAVGRVEQFGQAVRAGGGVGRDAGLHRARAAGAGCWKAASASSAGVARVSSASTRASGGASLFRRCSTALQRLLRPLHLDVHALRVVAHPAGQAQFLRQAIDEGPEAHALHDAAHADRAAFDGLGVGQHGACASGRLQPRDLRLEFGHALLQRRHLVQPLLARGARARLRSTPARPPARRRWWPRPAGSRSTG